MSAVPAVTLKRAPEPESRRSRQPVRRDSRMTGAWEDQYIRPMTWKEADDLYFAALRYDRASKKPGDRNGPIGSIGLELLRELVRMARNFGGKVWPTLDTLQSRIRRSRDTVVRYLRKLFDLKIVDWTRRIDLTEGEWERGPQVRQISNLYRLAMPKILRRFVRTQPAPVDDAHRKAAMLAQLAALEREEAAEGVDAAIARGQARAKAANTAARSEKEREYDRPSQTMSKSDSKGVRVPRTDLFRRP